jgi:NTP pyrophosphatase (non-canonical NTP hydrolase)
MKLNEYQALAMRTANPDCIDISNAALGMCGEAGEFADELKKHLYQGRARDDEKLKKELGDVLWYVALACQSLGCTMDDVASSNVEKLRKRYPDVYSHEASLKREDV